MPSPECPGVLDRVPEIQPEVQHLPSEDVLHLRGETGEIVLHAVGQL